MKLNERNGQSSIIKKIKSMEIIVVVARKRAGKKVKKVKKRNTEKQVRKCLVKVRDRRMTKNQKRRLILVSFWKKTVMRYNNNSNNPDSPDNPDNPDSPDNPDNPDNPNGISSMKTVSHHIHSYTIPDSPANPDLT